ncbi:MAG TPA: hypothetical protein V6C97_27925 [Oculatellaceae cyanobacterium]
MAASPDSTYDVRFAIVPYTPPRTPTVSTISPAVLQALRFLNSVLQCKSLDADDSTYDEVSAMHGGKEVVVGKDLSVGPVVKRLAGDVIQIVDSMQLSNVSCLYHACTPDLL